MMRMTTMTERTDLFTLTFVRYHEPLWGWRNLGPGRRALDLGHLSLIFEAWFLRGGLEYA
jgi:hypothetical protein